MSLDRGPLVVPIDAPTQAVLLLTLLLLGRVTLGAGLRATVRIPGRLRRLAAHAARALRPGAARRLLSLALGLGLTPVATGADLPAAAAEPVGSGTAGLSGPASRPGSLGPVPPRTARTAQPVVVIVPGDTLWDIARRHLPAGASPADVAREWPRWYAANRAEIGPDPALIRPGTRLRLPDRRSTGTSTSSHDRPPATDADAGAVARSLDPDRR